MLEPFRDFRTALFAWTDATWNKLRDTLSMARRNPTYTWARGGDVVGGWSRVPEYSWPEEIEARLLFSPEWEIVKSTLFAHPTLRRHLSQLVGTALGTHAIVPNAIAFSMWPTARLIAYWHAGEDPCEARHEEFERLYRPISDFFVCDVLEFISVIPLAGLSSTCGSVELEPHVEIDRLSEEEIGEFLERELLTDEFGQPYHRNRLPEYMRYGLRRRVCTPKIFGDAIGGLEHETLVRFPLNDRKKIARALAVAIDGWVLPQAFIAKQAGWTPGGGATMAPNRRYPYPHWAGSKGVLDVANRSSLIGAWHAVSGPGFDAMSALRIPVDRLARLPMLETQDDITIDLAIAAEAFFRNGEDDARHHTGAVVASRAADYIDAKALSMNKKHLEEFFSSAYKIRNGLAHRGEFGADLLPIGADGNQMGLADFNEVYAMLLRRAVRRALTDEGAPVAPVWSSPPAASRKFR